MIGHRSRPSFQCQRNRRSVHGGGRVTSRSARALPPITPDASCERCRDHSGDVPPGRPCQRNRRSVHGGGRVTSRSARALPPITPDASCERCRDHSGDVPPGRPMPTEQTERSWRRSSDIPIRTSPVADHAGCFVRAMPRPFRRCPARTPDANGKDGAFMAAVE
jgi:hypothetical protein